MSRISYCEKEAFPGQCYLWQANCRRSLRGKRGQRELRALRYALLALPDKRLIHGLLVDEVGEVCAIGAYARHKGLDLQSFDSAAVPAAVGIEAGMPAPIAWKVSEVNDLELTIRFSPEDRYTMMLQWVNSRLLWGSQC